MSYFNKHVFYIVLYLNYIALASLPSWAQWQDLSGALSPIIRAIEQVHTDAIDKSKALDGLAPPVERQFSKHCLRGKRLHIRVYIYMYIYVYIYVY